ncbi:hypothetical protein BGW36DRAFT_465202 [Talaromyces proteolyticus]|uniref:SnoaL-like domain-containing protein n=1 Tax=Talaromyces proteolyticus TaxID=1131652 RepID=A0AAD4KHT1_9EURO|nr:uncharacterized protein BGW36DRAFT_465202 [Talaromyces proteolyticus]KAH8691459.1 hypothetical protein BGW36DRAFT_465202 [Talaromyces proteolyticus]
MATPLTTTSLKEIAKSIYPSITNKPRPESLVDLPIVQKYLSPDFRIYHDSKPFGDGGGRDAFLNLWSKFLTAVPDLHMEIVDAIAEVDDAERGNGRVWLYSRITGFPDGKEKEGVDMMTFENGVFVESRDVQRIL